MNDRDTDRVADLPAPTHLGIHLIGLWLRSRGMSATSGEEGNQGPTYQVGTVINGHVWTGEEWVPVVVPGRNIGTSPTATGKRKRGRWFRPGLVAAVWGALILVVLVLGFVPNPTLQTAISIVWMLLLLFALPATLIALFLWVVGVGGYPADE